MARSAVKFPQLLESAGTVDTEVVRGRPGAKVVEGWEQLVRDTASEVVGEKLIASNTAVKWWGMEVREAARIRREADVRYTSNKTTA